MSWLNTVLPFAFGFCKGFIEEYRPQSADPLPPSRLSRSYDFHAHMQELAAATGYYLGSVDDERAGFSVPAGGRDYTVILLLDEPKIVIRACSNIKFPRRCVPPSVLQVLVNRNRKLPRFSYDLIHASDSSYVYATGQMPAHALNLASFEAALTELITAVAALDHCLAEQGYSR